jgi:hypothetical protein
MTKAIKLVLKGVLLAVLLFVFVALAAGVSGVAAPPAQPATTASATAGAQPGSSAQDGGGALLLFCALASAVFTWAVSRSARRGWALVGGVFLAYFGLGTLLPQMESALFLGSRLPPAFVWRLVVMGTLVAALFAPTAVRLLGWRSPSRMVSPPAAPARWGPLDWTWRLALLAAVYVAVYFLAGYFIAYRNPEVVAFYHDTDAGSFLAGMHRIATSRPWLFALQALRGVLWVAFVVPFVVWFRGARLELAFLVGSLYVIWSAMLLVPNPFMPESVRLSHLVETGVSNFVFGCLVGALLYLGRTPVESTAG